MCVLLVFLMISRGIQSHGFGTPYKVVNLAGDVIIITAIFSVAATAALKLCRDGVSQEVVAFAPPSRWEMDWVSSGLGYE